MSIAEDLEGLADRLATLSDSLSTLAPRLKTLAHEVNESEREAYEKGAEEGAADALENMCAEDADKWIGVLEGLDVFDREAWLSRLREKLNVDEA
jgi:hypothetical protein